MKHIFAEKPFKMGFFGSIVLLSAVTLLLHSCKKETEKPSKKDSPKLQSETAKIVPKLKEDIDEKIENSDKRFIYLTFDDGPNRGTEKLLKILNDRKVVATSFVVGKHINGSQKQKADYQALENDSLIEIANHSYSHADNKYAKFYSNPDAVVADFKIAKDSLKIINPISRTPGRNIWRINGVTVTDIKSSKTAADQLQLAGFKLVGWDLEWRANSDMTLKNNHQEMMKKVDSIFFNDLENTPRHLVLLTHDQYLNDDNSAKELELFIEKMQESNRFEFRKISDYPKIKEILN